MRFRLPAMAVSLCLMPLGAGWAVPPAAPAKAPATAAPAPAAMPDSSGADAAARHAKRTACLREAKAKKLLGADKNAYIKDCIGSH